MRAMLLAAVMVGVACAAAPPATYTPDQEASRHEAIRLWQAGGKAWKEGRRDDAIPLMTKALQTHTRLVGPWHRDVDIMTGDLAEVCQVREDWPGEAHHRRAILEARRRLYGEEHWRTRDARHDLAEALAQAKRTPKQRDALRRSMALNNRAAALRREGKPAEALPLSKEALALRKDVLGERHPDYATTLNNLAFGYQAIGDHKTALPLCKRALELRKELLGERHPLYATTLNNLAGLYADMGDLRAALPLLRRVRLLRKELLGDRHPDHATALNNLAGLLQETGDREGALSLFTEALALSADALGVRHPRYIDGLHNLGSAHHLIGDHEAALRLYGQALALRKEIQGEKLPAYASTLQHLAVLHADMGRHRAALPLIHRALAIQKAVLGQRHPDHANGLSTLAELYHHVGDFEAALHLYEKALAIRKAALGERHPEYARSLHGLAGLYHAMGRLEDSLPLHEKALALQTDVLGEKHPSTISTLNNLALLHVSMGRHGDALPLYKKALAHTRAVLGEKHPHHAGGLNNLADLYRAMGDHEAALPLYERALAAYKQALGDRHPHYATTLDNLALSRAAMRDPEAALGLSEKALAITLANLRSNASVLSDRQQLAAASAFRHRLDVRLSLPDGPRHPPAAAHALAWKGSLLLHQQQRRLFLRLAQDDETKAAAEALQSATRRLAALRLSPAATVERLDTLTREQEDAQANLARLSTAFRAQLDRKRPTDVLAASLPEGAALVDYVFFWRSGLKGGKPYGQRSVVAFVHRKGRPAVPVHLEAADAIEKAVRQWRTLLVEGKLDGKAGSKLKDLIWSPLEKHLAGAKVILISPDGVLGTVPFTALPGKADGSYLIEDVALAIVPVPSAIPDLMKPIPDRERLAPSLLVVGGVDYKNAAVALVASRGAPLGIPRDWGSLPGTAIEARFIAKSFASYFKGGRLTELSTDTATTAAVRAALPRARYAHLATHGFFAPNNIKSLSVDAPIRRPDQSRTPTGWHPLLLSGLAFAGANKEPRPGEADGILTALEVSEMDLTRLELAVLSACETGLGEIAGGEGILGMQRAFQIAGARSVVASLWKVDDLATQQLMSDFYSIAWDAKKAVSRAEALRKAQISMIFGKTLDGKPRGLGKLPEKIELGKGGRLPPFYWAAFVLSGDWR